MVKHIKDLILLYASKIISSFSNFLAQIIAARILSEQNFGALSFLIVCINILASVSAFGSGEFLIRKFSIENAKAIRWMKAIKKYNLYSYYLIIPIFIILSYFILGLNGIFFSLMLTPLILNQSLVMLTTAVFQIKNNYSGLSVYLTVQNISYLISSISLLAFKNFEILIVVYGTLALILMINSFKIIQNFYKEKLIIFGNAKFSDISVLEMLKELWPYGSQSLLYMLYFQGNILILSYFLGDRLTGIYSAIFTIINLILVAPTVLFQLYLLPKINKWIYEKDLSKLYFLKNVIATLFFILGLFLCISLNFVDKWILNIIYGDKFIEYSDLFCILSIILPLRFFSTALGTLLVDEKMIKIKVKVFLCATIVMFITTTACSLNFGLNGSAVGIIFSELLIAILFFRNSTKLLKELDVKNYEKTTDQRIL